MRELVIALQDVTTTTIDPTRYDTGDLTIVLVLGFLMGAVVVGAVYIPRMHRLWRSLAAWRDRAIALESDQPRADMVSEPTTLDRQQAFLDRYTDQEAPQ